MFYFRTWQLGVKSLLLHPLRSLLTVLGIFIGVASVIWLLAIGEGISQEAQRQIESLGASNVIVRTVKPPSEVLSQQGGMVPYGLTRNDFDILVETIPTVTSAIPIREIRRQFRYGTENVDGRLVGCTPQYADVTQLRIDRGRFLGEADLNNYHTHCVLAASVAERLFGYENPLGQRVYLNEHQDYYTVVGVLKHRMATSAIGGSLAGQNFANDVYIPITTLNKRIGDTVRTVRSGTFEGEEIQLNQITFRVDTVENVLPTADLIKLTLANHDAMQDIAITVPLELLEQAKTTRMMFMLFMGLIAAVSLLVGGVGIMNIMLATVTERTREIGIRRALGARRDDITHQFLIETVSLSVVGGATGILGGFACLPAVKLTRYLLEKYAPETMNALPTIASEITPQIVPISIPLAFGISVMVGIVFGIYPAMRAAQMDPIEALRHE